MRSIPRRVRWLVVSLLPAATVLAGALFLLSDSFDTRPVAAATFPAAGSSPVAARQGISATVWTTEVITSGAGIALVNDALQLDGDDVPSLAFARTDPAGQAIKLYFAQRKDAGWAIEPIAVDTPGLPSTPSLGIDALSAPHVSFAISSTVYYARRTGGSWQIDVVDQVAGADIGTALAVNSTGTIGIAYSSGGLPPQSVYFAEANGGDWTITRVATSTLSPMQEYSTFSEMLDTAFDGGGQPHVTYVSSTYAPRPYAWLGHVARIGGNWQYRGVAGESYLHAHAMTLKNDQNDLYAYRVFGPHCVIPCPATVRMVIGRLGDDTAWPGIVAEYIGFDGRLLSLDTYGGAPEVLFDVARPVSSAGGHAVLAELRRDYLHATDPRSDVVAVGNLMGATLAVTNQGQPLVVYYDAGTQELVITRPEQLTFAHGLYLPNVLVEFDAEE